jgi:hypothetical protein
MGRKMGAFLNKTVFIASQNLNRFLNVKPYEYLKKICMYWVNLIIII